MILGALVLGLKIKWAFFGVMLGFGVMCIGITAMYIVRRRRLKLELLTEEMEELIETEFEQ